MEVTFVTGTAGSGKSLLTGALKNWYVNRGEDAIAVNLDPGVVELPYDPDVDVRDKVQLQEVMQDYGLGPNGALIMAADLTATKLAEIQDEIDSFRAENVIVDTPGQTELFAFRESGEFIVGETRADSKVLLFLLDPLLASTPSNFLSLALLSASVGLRLKVPKITVLTKRDIARDGVKRITEWSKDTKIFEDALSATKDGEQYSLYSELFRSIRRLSFGTDLYPVSSTTQEGMIALVGEMTRIARGGEEFTD
ncbi:MAG: ATP/GTP-binding protein [Nitrososphaerota archaeon]|jgi:GTPase SAR1 family protein|nr:ATP/GTP-binding protein [Nitrososphaerota archaeon]MDG6916830.1 ATP/GTP-binding protein [Nitrososphaerota archaeon]MDG7011691.1 ATP/GTP-binding protein [Nitrososphaerota archaeon]